MANAENVDRVEVKKTYLSPTLTEYGTLEKLTLNSNGTGNDAGGSMFCL